VSIVGSVLSLAVGQTPLISLHGRSLLLLPEAFVLILTIGAMRDWPRIRTTMSGIPIALRAGLCLLLAGAIVGAYQASDLATGIGAVKTWFLFPMALLVLLVSDARLRSMAIRSYVLIAVCEGVFGLAKLAAGHGDGRLLGTFDSPNFAAMLFGPALIFALLEYQHTEGRQKLWMVTAGILGLSIVATGSVGAMLGLVVAGTVAAFRLGLPPIARRVLASSLVLLVLFGGLIALSRVRVGSANSFESRIQIWHTAVSIGARQPLAGIGISNFPARYAADVVATIGGPPIEWGVPLPHDLSLAFWLSLGVLGLAGYWLLLGESLKPEYGMAMLPFIALSGHGLIDTPFFFTPIVYVFWLALAAGVSRQYNQSVRSTLSKRRTV
jgi:O-Antigen ligase